MARITITEALAELKTIEKRVQKKREHVTSYLSRQEGLKDPLEKDGGSAEVIKREMQAIADLLKRHVAIRTAIQKINQQTEITILDTAKTIAEWLTWRKEIAPGLQRFIEQTRQRVLQVRAQAHQKGQGVVQAGQQAQALSDVIINVDESELAKQAETLENILGSLDGQLSLKNATVTIEI